MERVAGLNRSIHPVANIAWAPLSQIAPDVGIHSTPAIENGDGKPEEPMALAFTDPQDGETHVYVFTQQGKENLMRTLTGGIIVPK